MISKRHTLAHSRFIVSIFLIFGLTLFVVYNMAFGEQQDESKKWAFIIGAIVIGVLGVFFSWVWYSIVKSAELGLIEDRINAVKDSELTKDTYTHKIDSLISLKERNGIDDEKYYMHLNKILKNAESVLNSDKANKLLKEKMKNEELNLKASLDSEMINREQYNHQLNLIKRKYSRFGLD